MSSFGIHILGVFSKKLNGHYSFGEHLVLGLLSFSLVKTCDKFDPLWGCFKAWVLRWIQIFTITNNVPSLLWQANSGPNTNGCQVTEWTFSFSFSFIMAAMLSLSFWFSMNIINWIPCKVCEILSHYSCCLCKGLKPLLNEDYPIMYLFFFVVHNCAISLFSWWEGGQEHVEGKRIFSG